MTKTERYTIEELHHLILDLRVVANNDPNVHSMFFSIIKKWLDDRNIISREKLSSEGEWK